MVMLVVSEPLKAASAVRDANIYRRRNVEPNTAICFRGPDAHNVVVLDQNSIEVAKIKGDWIIYFSPWPRGQLRWDHHCAAGK
jgi:hypothetical protein